MSITLRNALFDYGDDLESALYDTLRPIIHCMDEKEVQETGKGVSWPATKWIAKKAHLSEATVKKAIPKLIERGFLKCTQKPGMKRYFWVSYRDFLRALGATCEEASRGQEIEGGKEVNGGQEIPTEGVKNFAPGGYENVSGGGKEINPEHIREQGMNKKTVVPVPTREESALHPTIDDFGIPAAAKDKATSTEAPEAANPQPPRPLQGPSYLDPVPFDEIVAAYNRHMAHIGGKVRALEPAQTDAVVAFWECLVIELWKTKDDELRTRPGALEQVDHYFRHCAQDGFINGTAKRKPEYKGWIAKFDWLIRESTLRKMLGGGYAPSGAGKKEGR